MIPTDKKLKVFQRLEEAVEPIGMLELLAKLGDQYSARSVRRWLTELVEQKLVEKIGFKRGTKYRVIPGVGKQLESTASFFGSESRQIVQQIQRPLYERMPISYQDSWLDAYRPNITFYIPLPIQSQLYQAGKRSANHDPAGTYAHQIFNRLLIDLSYNSSRLEGNTYSLLDTERLLFKGAEAEGKLNDEKVMILNHKEAIRYLVDAAPRLQVTREAICTLHFLLADGLVEPQYAGKVRDYAVRIGGSVYMPFEDPKQLELRLSHITQKAALIENPYEQSFFLLVHLSYIQAFVDVNKRTARLAANITLIKNNLVPQSFNDVKKEDYMEAMIAVYELQNVKPLLDVYLFSYLRTCQMYDVTVQNLGFDEVRVRYRSQRRATIRNIITQKIVGTALQEYISFEAVKIIPEKDRAAFVRNMQEDLRDLDESRIAGLGITVEEFRLWRSVIE